MNNSKYFVLITSLLLIFSVNIFAVDIEAEIQEKYQKKLSYKLDVYNRTLQFIKDNPNSHGLATLYYNLAEMSTEINVNDPKLSVEYFQNVLKYDSEFDKKDAVLYNLGYYSTESQIGKRDISRQNNIDLAINWPDSLRVNEENLNLAIDSYETIRREFPNSAYFSEATYRLGNLYFEIAIDARIPREYFDKAISYYDDLANKENDPLQYHGIFQRGWAYFASARFEEAIEQFTTVLQIIEADSADTFKAFFEADAVENIAYSLIEYDGTDFEKYSHAAAKAVNIFQNYVNDEYVKDIIFNAVDLKLLYNAPMQAMDLYNSYLTLFPNNLDAPVIIDSIMTIYKNYPSRTRNDGLAENLIIDEMKRIVNTYHSNSEWYKVNKNTLSDNAISIVVVKDAFEFLEPRYFNNFVRSKRYDDYLTYRDLIKNYVDFEEFSDSISVAKKFEMQLKVVNLSQEIAESNEDPHDYFVAINNIIEFDSLYGNHDHIFQFREMKYSDYEQIYTLLQDTVKVASYIDSELEIALDENGLDSLYTQASKEYQDFLTNAENIGKTEDQILARIVYQRAEMNYSQNRLDAAYTDFSQLLSFVKDDTLATDDNIQKIALSRLAEISQGRGDFSVAENYYREAAKYASDNDREDLRNNMLASIQFKADTFVDSSDHITAAVEFLRLSEELFADDLQKSLGFKAKAIENYKSAGENQKAIDLLLEIASHKEEKMEVLAAFLSAWTITDSLNDFSQSEMLRRMFIEKYPNSNEAYQLRVQIIDFYENEPYNDKMKAAEMYLALYEDADQIDIGDVSRASIFLKAISIYQEAEMSDKLVDLMLEFEKLYPDHEMANDFLTFVASIYNEREETEKFEDLARKIYRKDPSIDLLSAIAVDNLKALKREVDDLFEAEHYEQMFVKMEEFNNATSSYKDDGLTLPLDAIYDSFNYYRDYINYYKKFDGVIAKITDEFLNASPGELLRVNELTKWKEHLSAGKRRITKLMEKCVATKKELIALIQEGNEYNLSVEKRTEALYLAGKVYEYGSEVVKIQILKFVETSKQLNNEALAANPIEQTRFKNRFIRESHKISSQFKLESVKVYNSMLVTFSDDKDYSDQYTELAKQRLVDWGVRTPKIYVNKYTDLLWKFSNSTVANLDSIDTWENVQIEPEVTLLDSAAVIILSPAENNLVKYNFNIEYLPEVLSIQYVSELPATIYLNGKIVEKEASKREDIEYDTKQLSKYVVNLSTHIQVGDNEIIFQFPGDFTKELCMAAHLKLQYDEQKLEIAKTTEKKQLLSDFTWKAIMKEGYSIDEIYSSLIAINDTVSAIIDTNQASIIDSIKIALDWRNAGKANLQFYKNQIFGMEESKAMGIWYPQIDTTKAETVILRKEFDVSQEIIDAKVVFIGQNISSIWINGVQIADKMEIVLDTKLMKVQANQIEINNLQTSKNVILVEVLGGEKFKGFVFELDYTVRK